MRVLPAVRFLLVVSLAPTAWAQGAGNSDPGSCSATPSPSLAPFDTTRLADLAGVYDVVLVDTNGVGGAAVKHRGRLTLWLQETRPTRRGLPTRPLAPGQKLLAGAWDAQLPDSGALWRRIAAREQESPGVLWQDGFLRLGEFGALLGYSLYVQSTGPSELRGIWNSSSGLGITVDYTGDRPREQAGYYCATRVP